MANITFRSSRIVYYGPHPCDNCSELVVKMGKEWGGNAFTAPQGPIYPNTEWHPHVCNPSNINLQNVGGSLPPNASNSPE